MKELCGKFIRSEFVEDEYEYEYYLKSFLNRILFYIEFVIVLLFLKKRVY